jgi:hypothetical protein
MNNYLIIISIVLSPFICTKTSQSFNFKLLNCEEVLSGTSIYLDSVKVGEIESVEFDSSLTFCFGKLKFNDKFQVYSNMEFYNELSLIDQPVIVIKVNSNKARRLLSPNADTILVFTRKQY